MNAQLIRDLRSFGLSEYEAKAYLALSVKGPLTASMLSTSALIPVSKIYGVMRSLQTKSLVESQATKPCRYRAAGLAHWLRRLLEEKRKSVEKLEKRTDKLLAKLKPLRMASKNSELWIASGRRAFLQKASEMLSMARSSGCATTARFSRHPALDSALSSALSRGIMVRILGTASLDSASAARASWYAAKGAAVRILPMTVQPIIGLRDTEEVAIRIDNGNESDFIWSNNPQLVNVMASYFDSLWQRAKPLQMG